MPIYDAVIGRKDFADTVDTINMPLQKRSLETLEEFSEKLKINNQELISRDSANPTINSGKATTDSGHGDHPSYIIID